MEKRLAGRLLQVAGGTHRLERLLLRVKEFPQGRDVIEFFIAIEDAPTQCATGVLRSQDGLLFRKRRHASLWVQEAEQNLLGVPRNSLATIRDANGFHVAAEGTQVFTETDDTRLVFFAQ